MPGIHAAGFVLYRREGGQIHYLALRNAGHGDVGLPKGKRDGSEDAVTTALRETAEETGIGPRQLERNPWFERAVTYPVRAGVKEVTYLLARTDATEVALSAEHDRFDWLDLDEALAAVRHENLRGVLRDAATFLKDPILRRGLAPAAARALLESRVAASVAAHTAQVAGMARAMATALGEVDADYVEAAAWLHDIGRARTHGQRHPLEGFRLVVEEGWPGYAPPCLSHYGRGAPRGSLGADADLLREMWEACDLDTFEVEERLVALADFMAVGDRRVPLEERHADLSRRYGESEFFDRSLDTCRRLKAEFEARTGRDLYEVILI